MSKFIRNVFILSVVCVSILTNSSVAHSYTFKAKGYAPTSDFGNKVESIKLYGDNLSKFNLSSDDFEIEYIDGDNIVKEKVDKIQLGEDYVELYFEAISYNTNFNITCTKTDDFNISKNDIKFDLGDSDKFKSGIHKATEDSEMLRYRLYTPQVTNDEKVPLVLVLHGGGEVGSDNSIQLTANDMITGFASDRIQSKYKSYVLAPQLPAELKVNVDTTGKIGWNEPKIKQALLDTLNDLESEYPCIDKSRIYITGCSMGAMGTWGMITSYPDVFAAAMPVCGQGDISLMENIKEMPIWAFHATNDPVVPMYGQKDQYKYNNNIIGTKTIVYRLKELGSNIKFTEFSEEDMLKAGVRVDENAIYNHFAWVPAYNNEESIDWLFSQRNNKA